MSDAVRWGILGNATIARVCVIPAIQKSRNGRVRALATRTPKGAENLAAQHRIPIVTDRYETLLEDPAIDALYIPLPNHLHYTWTLKALDAGKHVLCEKPMACNAVQALQMAETAEKTGRVLMEAVMFRFHPRSRAVRQAVLEGKIGTPRLIRAAFCFSMQEDLLSEARNIRLRPEMGGGALLDVGCYCTSTARWLFGVEPNRVQAQAVYHPSGVDIHVVGTLRFPKDALATFEASFITALQQTYTVVGSTGAIELPHNAFIPWEKDATVIFRKKDQEAGTEQIVPGADEYRLMVEHFADVVLGNTTPAYDPGESVRNMRVLDALAQAARTGKTVEL